MDEAPGSRTLFLSISTLLLVLLVLIFSLGCGPDGPQNLAGPGDDPGTLFFAQSELPNTVIEALFEGRVLKDSAGCLRLESSESATVIWPFEATLQRASGGNRVLDASGRVMGEVGDVFRFGGGFVGTLHSGIPLSKGARTKALSACPGDYWVVGVVIDP